MSVMREVESEQHHRWSWIGGLLLATALSILLFARTVDRDLNHDEHQFLAPAALLSRDGLLPWRDYPVFHLPNLIFAYAALDRLTGDLVFGAKMVSFAATAGVLMMLLAVCLGSRRRGALLCSGMLSLLLLSDPLVRYTAGKTWNHEVPAALILTALCCAVAAAKQDRLFLTAAAGVCGGMAAGCRATAAPALVGLASTVLFFPGSWKRRVLHLGVLTASATAALAPSLYFAFLHREAFVFGNLEFPRLRLVDPDNTRIQKTVSIWRKLRFFLKEVVVPSWPVFLLWASLSMPPALKWLKTRSETDRGSFFLVLLCPWILLGCFAPSRYQYQHFYVFIPLWLVGIAWGLNSSQLAGAKRRYILIVATLLSVVCVVRGSRDYVEGLSKVTQPSEWFSSRLADQEDELRIYCSHTGQPVLTLAPTLALAAKCRIYPEFATGPFAWRSAEYVSPPRRAALRMVAPEDLASFLKSRPPAGILTNVEDEDLEKPFVDWARQQGWRVIALRKKQLLWLP